MTLYLDSLDFNYHTTKTENQRMTGYNLQRGTMVTLTIITMILIVGLVLFSTQIVNVSLLAYGQSDLILEMNTANEKLSFLAIEGESYKDICPTGNCKIDDNDDQYGYFHGPSPEIIANNDFRLEDNVTYALRTSCNIDDIITENDQEIYTCRDGFTTIVRISDSKNWDYSSSGIYDAKNNRLKIYGNFTKNFIGDLVEELINKQGKVK